jgi:hypothetical protein
MAEETTTHDGVQTSWALPFGTPAELELHSEFGNLTIVPVEPDQAPRLELTRGATDTIAVQVERVGERVRVALDPQRSFGWFGGWECRARIYVPRDVRAHVQTNAGSVHVEHLDGCELGIKAGAGKIELRDVRGLIHLAADAGSVVGSDVAGYFDVQTQAGSVRMQIRDLQPGEHRIRASMGSVRVELARGIEVAIETHTQLGSVRNQYPSQAGARAKLVVSTEMGSVRIAEGSAPRVAWRPPARPPGPAESPAPVASAVVRADPELDRILEMVQNGQLSAHDADELLRAMGRV